MKNMYVLLVTCVLAALVNVTAVKSQNVKLEKLWESDSVLKVPESVRYCPGLDVLFVSSVNGGPAEKNGEGFISILNTDGTVKQLRWVEGLNAPKGMSIFNKKLYVADLTQLVVINIATATIEKRFEIDGATFLNDVATDKEDNTVYVSDSRAGWAKIYACKNDEVSLYYENKDIPFVNGLYHRKDNLYFGSNHFYVLNKNTKEARIVVSDTEGIDGLEAIDENLFIGTNWSGRILLFNANGELRVLEDLKEKGYNTADIGINRKSLTIFVPTFYKNSVIAYQYNIPEK